MFHVFPLRTFLERCSLSLSQRWSSTNVIPSCSKLELKQFENFILFYFYFFKQTEKLEHTLRFCYIFLQTFGSADLPKFLGEFQISLAAETLQTTLHSTQQQYTQQNQPSSKSLIQSTSRTPHTTTTHLTTPEDAGVGILLRAVPLHQLCAYVTSPVLHHDHDLKPRIASQSILIILVQL